MKYWLILIGIVLTIGCTAETRQAIIDVSAEDRLNWETVPEISDNLMAVWPYKSGLIRAGVGEDLPQSYIVIMDRLDELCEIWTNLPAYEGTECDAEKLKGEVIGLHLKLVKSEFERIITAVAPKIALRVFPLIGGF